MTSKHTPEQKKKQLLFGNEQEIFPVLGLVSSTDNRS